MRKIKLQVQKNSKNYMGTRKQLDKFKIISSERFWKLLKNIPDFNINEKTLKTGLIGELQDEETNFEPNN